MAYAQGKGKFHRRNVLDRLYDKTLPEPNSGCWFWMGTLDQDGYGLLWDANQQRKKAHVVSYELHVGPIPSPLQLDHLCRVRCCVNPRHLEPVTLTENLRRGLGNGPAIAAFRAKRAAITHCPYGHEYTPENTRTYKGMRRCRECEREYHRRKKFQT